VMKELPSSRNQVVISSFKSKKIAGKNVAEKGAGVDFAHFAVFQMDPLAFAVIQGQREAVLRAWSRLSETLIFDQKIITNV
jgi:hypothetical protein